MKIGVARRGDASRLCAIVEGWAVDLAPLAGADAPPSLLGLGDFLRAGEAAHEVVRGLLDGIDPESAGGTRVEETQFQAPYVPGAKIVCHAINYRAHAGAVGAGDRPFFFYKPPTSVIDPGNPIEPHANMSNELDFETELALVIGRDARDLTPESAYDAVAGYTVLNDVSHREYQFNTHAPDLRQRYGMNWTQGKGLDGSCAIGPWLTLKDELPRPYPLRIRCWVDGDLRQEASTEDMIFKIPELLAEITRGMTFRPGDVMATGTPPGTILDSGGPWLQPGNVVRCEIEGLGVLENIVGAP